jgi:hypothetical protein
VNGRGDSCVCSATLRSRTPRLAARSIPENGPTGSVEEEAAVAAALRGFEDGLYAVVLDGAEQRDLDRQVYLTEESRLVFLRLTFSSSSRLENDLLVR